MTTKTFPLTSTWQRIALAAEDLHLVTVASLNAAEIATSTDEDAPDGLGHRLEAGGRYSRDDLGPGAIWARVAPGALDSTTIVASVS